MYNLYNVLSSCKRHYTSLIRFFFEEVENYFLILFQLHRQILRAIKLPLASDALHKADEQELVIDVTIEIEDVRLQGYLLAIEGGAVANVHHASFPYHRVLHTSLHSINTWRRNQLSEVRDVNISSWKSHLPALMIAIHHLSDDGVRITETSVRHLNLAFLQEGANHGRGDVDAIYLESLVLDNLNTHLLAVAHVILERFLAIMPETMVVADEEFPHVEMVVEHLLHKFPSRECRHLLVEMQDHGIIHFRLREQQELGVERAQHLWLVIALQDLARMLIKGDDSGLQSILSSRLHEMTNQKLMSPMHTIKEADGCHTRRQFFLRKTLRLLSFRRVLCLLALLS